MSQRNKTIERNNQIWQDFLAIPWMRDHKEFVTYDEKVAFLASIRHLAKSTIERILSQQAKLDRLARIIGGGDSCE